MVRDELEHALRHYVKDPVIAETLLRKAWGYTMKEIAEMLGTTEKALDGVLQRRRRKLREHVRNGEEGNRSHEE